METGVCVYTCVQCECTHVCVSVCAYCVCVYLRWVPGEAFPGSDSPEISGRAGAGAVWGGAKGGEL